LDSRGAPRTFRGDFGDLKSINRPDIPPKLPRKPPSVETSDRPGLLLAITLAVFRARVQIVASSVHTKYGTAADRFTIAEPDATPLSLQRRRAVQAAILAALDRL
jgi:hypothetical protein